MSDVNEGTQDTPAPGTPEYDTAMASRYQEAQGQDTPAGGDAGGNTQTDSSLTIKKAADEEPLILGKFKTEDEALAYIQELEAKTAPADAAAETPAGTPEDQPNDPPTIPADLFEKAASEFEAGDDITPETREALTKAGIPQQFIDTYLEGVRAQSAAILSEAQGLVGGSDNWDAMMKWAATLPEKDVDAFNKAVTDPATASLAIQGMFARFTSANGAERQSVTAGADHAAVGADVYRSRAEMTSDMRDPRYAADPAYRDGVVAKIARSRKAGTLDALGVSY